MNELAHRFEPAGSAAKAGTEACFEHACSEEGLAELSGRAGQQWHFAHLAAILINPYYALVLCDILLQVSLGMR